MLSFIALSWNNEDEHHRQTASFLRNALQSGASVTPHVIDTGFEVLVRHRDTPRCIHPLPTGNGILLGRLFLPPTDTPTPQSCQPLQLTAEQARRVIDTQGQWLTRHCWGSYVALLSNPSTRRRHVMTSPCGNLPCHISQYQGVKLVFSDIRPLLSIKALAFRINDTYLESALALGGITSCPPLTGVRPVYRGECVSLGPDSSAPRKFHWHPATFTANNESIENPVEAGRRLRSTTHACTHTLADDHDSALLRLSGGLDSSIIAGCLSTRTKQNRLTCYTYYAPTARSRELQWAEIVAHHHALDHRPCPVEDHDIDLRQASTLGALIAPTPMLPYILRSTLEQRLATATQATAVFTGDGGDSGFCGDSYAYALHDHLKRHGPSLRMFTLAAQIALLTHQSSWTVLQRSIKRWRKGSDMQQHHRLMAPTCQLINPDLRDTVMSQQPYPHPWFEDSEDVPWPLIRRLGMLTGLPQPYSVENPEHAPEVITPLYAQPVMELLLRIPTYVHFLGGRERGLARQAFTADIPAQISQRRWKDRPANSSAGLIDTNRTFLQETLLEGELVRHNLLNRNAVEAALSVSATPSRVYPIELLKYLDYEFWLRAWRRQNDPFQNSLVSCRE